MDATNAISPASSLPDPSAEWRPRVSIVLLTYNRIDLLQQCLVALAENTPGDLYELIVVDNASKDGSREFLCQLEGDVRLLLNGDNLGFVGGCNGGARLAAGDYIVLLNNDTIPLPGWLERMVELADSDPSIAVVSPKFLYPNGRVNEAGGIIFSDGSGWNYGRGDDPNDPRYNFVRDVDYCSFAAPLIRRDVWEQLGGLDTRYKPAYYEDTDLCFGVRTLGYRVVYQPASRVVHIEGGTNGTNTASGHKAYQVVNQQKFRQKWAEVLAGHNPKPAAESDVRRASVRGRETNLLVVDPLLATAGTARAAGEVFDVLRRLRGLNHHVTFLAHGRNHDEQALDQLRQSGVEIWPAQRTGPDGVVAAVERICADLEYGTVWLPDTAGLIQALRPLMPAARFVVDGDSDTVGFAA
jgi:O-antigen biosynthesis protein